VIYLSDCSVSGLHRNSNPVTLTWNPVFSTAQSTEDEVLGQKLYGSRSFARIPHSVIKRPNELQCGGFEIIALHKGFRNGCDPRSGCALRLSQAEVRAPESAVTRLARSILTKKSTSLSSIV